MSRRRTASTKKKLALLVTAAAVAGGGAFALATTSNASQPAAQNAKTLSAANSTVCQGLATALGNNQKFIDGQRATPDAQSSARIANREAVIAQIKVQQKASGCAVGESAQDSQVAQPAQSAPAGSRPLRPRPRRRRQQRWRRRRGQPGVQRLDRHALRRGRCAAASSNKFPAGTTLKVTNLDNNKSTTVKVTSVSGSCVLLNNAAFEQVREPGKFLIRRALIQKVG